ncbi:MAG: GNAT family N-acetyltransferase [Oscillatoriales cyanobacterium RU_3_3]|nr:GNAT family N-acetyltransferase [Microcoleus sp. SU_5_6]NJL67155.1 GNAT family N-acetyltransferase [Microcoleus sp. SM1_3_4]NJM61956.1 GNAT family N-acetyltransferase [Oscillatoriales cyanobacterium RU_3_3]NJR21131.1 GNAT family N-acetyltransferase [Richelia sp. CSU_2_1]
MNVKITDLLASDEPKIQQVAQLIVEGFKDHWPDAWPDINSALLEVQESFGIYRISRIAVSDSGQVLGWIGGIKQYGGNVWELHPLVVKTEFRRQGIGRQLVADLAAEAKKRGGLVLWVGTDDEDNQTTLSGINLFPNVWEHIANIKNLRNHPYEFYQKMGFAIVGIMPDANGIGKPDIYMAKRL